jgi:hypothetical protein
MRARLLVFNTSLNMDLEVLVDSLMVPVHGAIHLLIVNDESATKKKTTIHDDDDDLCGLLCVDWSSDFEKFDRHPWTCVEACH